MDDDWTLRDKVWWAFAGQMNKIKPSGIFDVEVYHKQDIEILRQKIIEDIKHYFSKISEENENFALNKIYKCFGEFIASEIIKIINHRFGVDEDGQQK